MILKVTFDKKSLLFKIYNKNAIFFKFRQNYFLCINFTFIFVYLYVIGMIYPVFFVCGRN